VNQAFMAGDAVEACADLVGRCGASGFEIGYVHEDVPVEEAGWYAHAQYSGARLQVQDHRSPSGAALALAERLLAGGVCKCRKPVTLADDTPGCRWQLMGKRWEPGCDVPAVRVDAARGDLGAMQRAMATPPPLSRRDRRRRRRPNQS
jgi:hypothetical protein